MVSGCWEKQCVGTARSSQVQIANCSSQQLSKSSMLFCHFVWGRNMYVRWRATLLTWISCKEHCYGMPTYYDWLRSIMSIILEYILNYVLNYSSMCSIEKKQKYNFKVFQQLNSYKAYGPDRRRLNDFLIFPIIFPDSTWGRRWSVSWVWSLRGVTARWFDPEGSEAAGKLSRVSRSHLARLSVRKLNRRRRCCGCCSGPGGSWSAPFWTGRTLFLTETWTERTTPAGERTHFDLSLPQMYFLSCKTKKPN